MLVHNLSSKVKILSCFILLTLSQSSYSQSITPPLASKNPNQLIIHGDTIIDNYYWMRDKYGPEVINHLYAENEYADNVMRFSQLLQKVLFEELKGRHKQTFSTRASKKDGFYYYSIYEKGKEYAIHYRKDSSNLKEIILLDENKLFEKWGYANLSDIVISPNQQLLYFGVDKKGDNLSDYYLKKIENDSVFISDTIKQAGQLIWAEDNKTVYYITLENKTYRPYRLIKHTLGTPVANDILIYEEKNKLFNLSIDKSSTKKYFFLSSESSTSNQCLYFKTDGTSDSLTLFLPRKNNVRYQLDHYENDEFYIITNLNAPDFRLATASISNPDLSKWTDIIPARKNIILENVEMLKDFLIVKEKENVQSKIRIINRHTGLETNLAIEALYYEIDYHIPDYNYYNSSTIEFSYSSLTTPRKVFLFNLYTRDKILLEEDTILGNFKPDQYEMKRIYAIANDSAKIPISLVYKKGIVLNSNNPMYLTSYGSYGTAQNTSFRSSYLSYLERGFIIAIAHVRGGTDLGTEWYNNGKLLTKKNTFSDFISCTEKLIADQYTNPQKIIIQGASAGGLLIGAVINMRPDLYKCAIANVPFVDVINTMLDESLPLTVGEFEEWGNPKEKKYYDYMKSYSPYENISPQNYPTILVTAGYDDSQVSYWEAAKWVAKLREVKTDTNLILLQTAMQGGHQSISGRYNRYSNLSFAMAFAMQALNINENYITISGKIIDENRNEIPYANVYIEGTSNGTTSNASGDFSLRTKEFDNTILSVQSIGFTKYKEKLTIKSPTDNLVIKLKSEDILMKEVLITANSKDPALGIIKEAIKRRKDNQDKIKSYEADVYMKSETRLIDIPKDGFIYKFMIIDGDTTGISYRGLVSLSESVAKYYFESPNLSKEEMLASKVAGEGRSFSWNRVEDVLISFYKPTFKLGYYSEREFISPIAPTALVSYKYKYLGTIYIDNKPVHKIYVEPRMKGDPAFYGDIYITEDNYQIYSCNLYATKEQQIEYTDTVYVKQEMTKIDSIWMPVQLQVSARIDEMGFDAMEVSRATISNYIINKPFPKKFFNKELFKINLQSNKRDSTYWRLTRPAVLTKEEDKYYIEEDSIETIKKTQLYRDSLLIRGNKFDFKDLFFSGYSRYFISGDRLSTLNFPGFWKIPLYNTVQGTNLTFNPSFTITDKVSNKKEWIKSNLNYGTDNKKLNINFTYGKEIDLIKKQAFVIDIGRFAENINDFSMPPPIVNSLFTLLGKQNYIKLYQEGRISVTYGQELFTGLILKAHSGYRIREPLTNTSYYYWLENKKRTFTSNNPLRPQIDTIAFSKHQLVDVDITLTILPFAKYIIYPNQKKKYISKWPEITVYYKKGMATKGADFNYDFLKINAGYNVKLRTWGKASLDISGGNFFNNKNMNFIDYNHFNGNQTFLLYPSSTISGETRKQLTAFKALNYYTFSTNNRFIEIHLMHNFNSFFVGKIPLLRKTKIYEMIGTNMLITSSGTYTEYYIGADKIFNFLQIEGVVTYNNAKPIYYLRFGLRFDMHSSSTLDF